MVNLTYSIKDGERIALQIESSGYEIERPYSFINLYYTGTILAIQEDFIELLLENGKTLKFDYRYAAMPDSYAVGDSLELFARSEEPFVLYWMQHME